MRKPIDVKILRVFVGEAARHKGRPLYEAIVEEARQRGMAGASVCRGFMGFGAGSLLHTAKILRLAEDLPVIVEIVDTPPRIEAFLPVVDAMVEEGSIVVQDGQAIFHLPLRIRDVMTENVATVDVRTPLTAVVDLLLRREVKAVPVMEGRRIAGIITGGDLLSRARMPLRLDMQGQLPCEQRCEQDAAAGFAGLVAQDIMTSPARTLNIKTDVVDALKIMAGKNIKRLPVTADDGTLLGIVSRTDVLAAIARASSVAGHLEILPPGLNSTARDALFTDVPTARPDTPLNEILEQLVRSPLRRVVIVDADLSLPIRGRGGHHDHHTQTGAGCVAGFGAGSERDRRARADGGSIGNSRRHARRACAAGCRPGPPQRPGARTDRSVRRTELHEGVRARHGRADGRTR